MDFVVNRETANNLKLLLKQELCVAKCVDEDDTDTGVTERTARHLFNY